MTIAHTLEMTGSVSPPEDEFLLKWHDHHQSFFVLVEELVTREQLTDVTLACAPDSPSGLENGGYQLLQAHSLMLSVCSPYFRSLLSENRHKDKHHIIHLHGVSARHMQQLLWYMYRGELSISQEDLGPLIETARCLQIKGLAMAATPPTPSQPAPALPPTPLSAKKRPFSQICSAGTEVSSSQPHPLKIPRKPLVTNKISVPQQQIVKSVCGPTTGPVSPNLESLEEEESGHEYDPQDHQLDLAYKMGLGHLGTAGKLSPLGVSLPLLPKPLGDLKTAETRTYLSKLVWLGNGGRRPQYGNPETKPCWWPQHILAWEDMKKMGGRKSVELSHINYTEVLKQCLAAGYEYFGYDPSTYFSSEPHEEASFSMMDDGHYNPDDSHQAMLEDGSNIKASEDPDDNEEDTIRHEGALEIDLDKVETYNPERNQIICQ